MNVPPPLNQSPGPAFIRSIEIEDATGVSVVITCKRLLMFDELLERVRDLIQKELDKEKPR